MTKKMGGIRDVARSTGLSVATISRVMNGINNVSPKTRERVLKACEKLDYLPNPAARALTTRRSKTIAAIIQTIEHSVFAKFVAAIERTLAERDYSLVLAVSNGNEEEELKAARKLLGMGAEAFILSGAAHTTTLLELLERRRIPHIFTSVWEPDGHVPTIGYDNFRLAKDAINYLVSKGHQHIAVIHGPMKVSDRTITRRKGAESASSDGVVLDFMETSISVEGGKSAIQRILTKQNRCSAVLCFSDVLALGVYFGMSEAGLKIPDDMSVMGFDNLDWSKDAVPPLTTINLPAGQMGHEVAQQIMNHVEDGIPLEAKFLDGQIVKRQSVRLN